MKVIQYIDPTGQTMVAKTAGADADDDRQHDAPVDRRDELGPVRLAEISEDDGDDQGLNDLVYRSLNELGRIQ